MKRRYGLVFKLLLCSLAFAITASTYAASFWHNWMKPFNGPDQNISILIVTGNYAKSRLLAEIIQRYNKQPILLTPAAGSDKVFFLPPERRSKALQIPYDEVTNFINFIGARQIIVLGDSQYVPDKYAKLITPNQITWRVTGENWDKVAESVGKFLNLTNVASDYKDLQAKMISETNYQRVGKETATDQVKDSNDIQILPVVTPDKTETKAQPQTHKIIDASQK